MINDLPRAKHMSHSHPIEPVRRDKNLADTLATHLSWRHCETERVRLPWVSQSSSIQTCLTKCVSNGLLVRCLSLGAPYKLHTIAVLIRNAVGRLEIELNQVFEHNLHTAFLTTLICTLTVSYR